MHRQRKKLTGEQINELQVAQDNSSDAKNALRFQAVRLYGSSYAVVEIEKICGCSRPSLLAWNRRYHQVGVAGLIDQRQGGNHALLSHEQLEQLQGWLHQYQPKQLFAAEQYTGAGKFWDVPSLALLVQEKYGVRYKRAHSYQQLFARCDFSYQRTSQQYRSRHEHKVIACEEALEKNSSTRRKPHLTP